MATKHLSRENDFEGIDDELEDSEISEMDGEDGILTPKSPDDMEYDAELESYSEKVGDEEE